VGDRGALYEEERLRLYVGEELARALEESGLSMPQVSEKAGYDASVMSLILAAKRDPSIESLARLAYAMGFRAVVKLERREGRRG